MISPAYTRILLTGEVDSGKTYSLLSFPGRKVVQFYPGEGGIATLGEDTAEVQRVFPPPTKVSVEPDSMQIITDVRKQTADILLGKHGECTTFCGDGLDKLHEYVLDALSGGAYFAGEAVKDAKDEGLSALVIARAEHWTFSYLNLVLGSQVPYAVFTCWDKDKGVRKAMAGEHWSKVPMQKYPNFYGGIARNILGKFGVKLHASRGKLKETDQVKSYRWLTQSTSTVACAGIKGDPAMIAKIPKYLEARWPVLESYLRE